jgi:DMSO/TMAO reductase YedYZ molybdopterin-dependent catalytic subunit
MASRRAPIAGRYTAEEVALAARNRGMPLEALRHEITPAGLHYLLIHFDIPAADEAAWRLRVGGLVGNELTVSLADLKRMPATTLRVTMECAGNGRGQLAPRYPSVPWLEEGVSTADWTGVPLAALLREASPADHATQIVFHGADRGFDAGVEHHFARSLAVQEALRGEVVLAYAMNGAALPPQHGAPLAPGMINEASRQPNAITPSVHPRRQNLQFGLLATWAARPLRISAPITNPLTNSLKP